jgi:lysozyme
VARNLAPAVETIRAFEGLLDGDPATANLDPYLCPAGYWTIGWGHVVRDAEGRMLKGQAVAGHAKAVYPRGITLEEARVLLDDDIRALLPTLEAVITVPVNDNQFSALTSFVFNIGIGAFKRASLLRKLNAGDYAAVPKELMRWVRAGGKVLAGLKRRRAAEARLWLKP